MMRALRDFRLAHLPEHNARPLRTCGGRVPYGWSGWLVTPNRNWVRTHSLPCHDAHAQARCWMSPAVTAHWCSTRCVWREEKRYINADWGGLKSSFQPQ